MNNINAAAICLVLACVLPVSVQSGTIVVTNTNDNGSGSLREALAGANDGDVIDATGVSGVITLTTGELLVDRSITINGPGVHSLAVDGNAASAVFHVTAIGAVTISDLTIRNGQGGQNGFGGGIINAGATLSITNTTITGNTAGFGAGIYNTGVLTMLNSTVSGNIGPKIVGGSRGGGVYNLGTMIIDSSTISGNLASTVGGFYNNTAQTLTITNSTVSGNVAQDYAGAGFNLGILNIAHSTVSDNLAPFIASGVINLGTVQIGNTVLKSGDARPTIYNNGGGTIMSLGYNLSSDDAGGFLTGPGDQTDTDPTLGPLQDNGGPTFTHELLPGSPAIDAGDPNFTPPPVFDQRGNGFDRVVNGRIDKGSYEVQGSTATPTPTPTATVTPTPTPTPTPRPTLTPRVEPSPRSRPTPVSR